MYDGTEPSKAMAAHRDGPEATIAEYEEAMFIRSAQAAAEAAKTHARCFEDDDAPRGPIDFLTRSESAAVL